MGKSRMLGAGSACSTLYGSNVNLKTCGGNKKQGLPFSIDNRVQNNYAIKSNAIGNKRDVVFLMNQLGGVSSSTFSSSTHAYASGDGRSYSMPFICSPYCHLTKLNRIYNPSSIPLNTTAEININKLNVFSYLNYNGKIYCFTDVSKFDLNFLHFTINGVSLTQYLTTYFVGLNVPNAINRMSKTILDSLREEDIIYGNQNNMKRETKLTNYLYSTPDTYTFLNGQSIASQLYVALQDNYPDKVNNCPEITDLLNVGDSLIFRGTFSHNNISHTINFKINIV
jgi:hypothetical protein